MLCIKDKQVSPENNTPKSTVCWLVAPSNKSICINAFVIVITSPAIAK